MSDYIEDEIWYIIDFFVSEVSTNKHRRRLIIISQ